MIDSRLLLSDAQAVTASAISSVIDLGATPTLRAIGSGRPMFVVVQVDEAATAAAGASNVTFSLESDSTANLATSATVHGKTAAIAKGTLVAGYRFVLGVPPTADFERYLGLRYTVDTNNLDGGKFSAFLTDDPPAWHAYPAGA